MQKNSFEPRYCDQNLFNILAFDRYGSLLKINCKDVEKARPAFSRLLFSKKQRVVDGLCLKGETYISIQISEKVMMLKKYSNKSKSWKIISCYKHCGGFLFQFSLTKSISLVVSTTHGLV